MADPQGYYRHYSYRTFIAAGVEHTR
jgi:hypothetical protein